MLTPNTSNRQGGPFIYSNEGSQISDKNSLPNFSIIGSQKMLKVSSKFSHKKFSNKGSNSPKKSRYVSKSFSKAMVEITKKTTYWMNELNNYQAKLTPIFSPVIISTYILHPLTWVNIDSSKTKIHTHTLREKYNNGFINTWILHQIIMYSNKVKLVAG